MILQVNPKEAAVTVRCDVKFKDKPKAGGSGTSAGSRTTIKQPKKLSLHEQMLAEAMQSASLGGGAAAAATATEAEGSDASNKASVSVRPLLEVQGPSKTIDVANIVRKPREEPYPSTVFSLPSDNFSSGSNATVASSTKVSQIEELD
jgi:hypothetical protein